MNEMNDNIDNLLRKYILNKCDSEEVKRVVEHFQNENTLNGIPTVENVLGILKEKVKLGENDAKLVYDEIANGIEKRGNLSSRSIIRVLLKCAVAAIFAGIVILNFVQVGDEVKREEIPFQGDQQITLELDNGTVQFVNPEINDQVVLSNDNVVGVQNGAKLTYTSRTNAPSLLYNTIRVPYGKTFQLTLSDNSVVYLNSGTQLRYPVNFVRGLKREIFLDGEAYFEVTKDENHPFYVVTRGVKVRVLGTKFNVSSYKEAIKTDVVLVEGAVKLSSKETEGMKETERAVILEPGDMGSFHRIDNLISVKQVSTDVYTSWMKGKLVFRGMTFDKIIKKLERHFNVRIDILDRELETETFNASFDKEVSLKDILDSFIKAHNIEVTYRSDRIVIE